MQVTKTFITKPSDIKKQWLLIDATSLTLGRLASEISIILRGKNKTIYSPNIDCGDNIVVINAEKIALSGKKANRKDGKIYYRHTGFPGGIKETTAGKMLEGKYPTRVLQLAVTRMLSSGPLARQQLGNLYIYAGQEHPHTAQQPVAYNFAEKNTKNKR
ncbi:MAG: 50S ribosomal protein L13 [Rickettsiaceae bacterium]|nr:50S ribosomal protein L13 [Rickettsiaceae bacterium]